MGNYKLNTDLMNDTASKLGGEAGDLSTQLTTFSAAVTNLLAEGYQTPYSSGQFSTTWDQFTKGYQSVVDGLNGLSKFLSAGAGAFDNTDQQLGNALSGKS